MGLFWHSEAPQNISGTFIPQFSKVFKQTSNIGHAASLFSLFDHTLNHKVIASNKVSVSLKQSYVKPTRHVLCSQSLTLAVSWEKLYNAKHVIYIKVTSSQWCLYKSCHIYLYLLLTHREKLYSSCIKCEARSCTLISLCCLQCQVQAHNGPDSVNLHYMRHKALLSNYRFLRNAWLVQEKMTLKIDRQTNIF